MDELDQLVEEVVETADQVLDGYHARPVAEEEGEVSVVSRGVIEIRGLKDAGYEELLFLPGNRAAVAFNLDEERISAILLDDYSMIESGQIVRRSDRVVDTPVGDELLGRVIDPLGRPLDGGSRPRTSRRDPIERGVPAIMDRARVSVQLHTGIRVIDALIPVGRGQRELIIGDRQTGKTAIALDTIINQRKHDVICIYCSIGKENSEVARVVHTLRSHSALDHCIVVAATGEDPPGLNFIAPYAATTMAEYFMNRGDDVLVVYDDLTRHARTYRELSLLLKRPPAREAYPGDIFYVHSRLLERSTHLGEELGGGSLTALPVVETQAENISAYIPTNLVSITDGQIYLSPRLFGRGVLPAVDVGQSVSRVGGKTQLPAYREVAGDLRLSYSQFQELETFSRFGTRLDSETRETLKRGRRVRECLKQAQYSPLTPGHNIIVLLAVTEGLLDEVDLSDVEEVNEKIGQVVADQWPDIMQEIEKGEELDESSREKILEGARSVIEDYTGN